MCVLASRAYSAVVAYGYEGRKMLLDPDAPLVDLNSLTGAV
jgi:hypothetical protein